MKRKILVISQDTMEFSTENVIDWINHLGYDFYRLNGDLFESMEKSVLIESSKDLNLHIGNIKVSKRYHSIWIRRWSSLGSIQSLINVCDQFKLDTELAIKLTACFAQGLSVTKDVILNMFNCKKILCNTNQLTVNKLNVLNHAKRHNLKVPNFILTNRKTHLIDFQKKNGNVILKDLDTPFTYNSNNVVYATYGELMSLKIINSLPDVFLFPFSKNILKRNTKFGHFF